MMDRKDLVTIVRNLLAIDEAHVSVIMRLRKAIERHRIDIWGDEGPIDHDSDLTLYAVLTDDDLEKSYRAPPSRKAVSGT